MIAQPYAIAFAKRGYGVLPLYGVRPGANDVGSPLWACTCGRPGCKSPGKHPHAALAHNGLKDATTDVDVVRDWFKHFPDANYGVLTDRIVVVDVDPRHGGRETWRKLLGTTRGFPHTWQVATGGDGDHFIFEQPSAEPLPSTRLGAGVDLKGVGGYIVGVGSLHISGKRYTWAPQQAPQPAEAGHDMSFPKGCPPWLPALIGRGGNGETEATKHDWKAEVTADVPEGGRNVSDAAMAGLLIRLEVPDQDVYDFLCWRNEKRRSDPLDEAEIRRTVKSVLKGHLARNGRGI